MEVARMRSAVTIVFMSKMTPEAISRAYNNRLLVPQFQDILALWDAESKLAFEELNGLGRGHWSVPYGPRHLNTLDVIEPDARAVKNSGGAPILFFIHGGYWRMLDKSAQTFIAPAWSARGAMVVIPNYTLAPAVSLEDISLEIVQALAWVWQNARAFGGDPNRIVVAGHSAGGHLTGMALSCDGQKLGRVMGLKLPRDLARRGLAISGLFDLAPLVHCEWLMPDIRLTPKSIARLSPARWAAPRGRHMVAVAGELESSEFHRQNQVIGAAWGRAAVPLVSQIKGRNHFDILLDMMEPTSHLSQLLARELELS
jgi:arylformamidase